MATAPSLRVASEGAELNTHPLVCRHAPPPTIIVSPCLIILLFAACLHLQFAHPPSSSLFSQILMFWHMLTHKMEGESININGKNLVREWRPYTRPREVADHRSREAIRQTATCVANHRSREAIKHEATRGGSSSITRGDHADTHRRWAFIDRKRRSSVHHERW